MRYVPRRRVQKNRNGSTSTCLFSVMRDGCLRLSRTPSQQVPSSAAPVTRAIIVDDSPADRLNLAVLLSRFPGLEVVGEAASAPEARELLGTSICELLFLDIELGPQSGFDVLAGLARKPRVIFTTVHRHYAVEAFDVGASDYLVKPISEERLMRALGRASAGAGSAAKSITVHRSGGERYAIALDTISAVVGDGDYSRVLAGTREHSDSRRLREWQELLSDFNMLQADRSTLLRSDHIVSWRPYGGGGFVTFKHSNVPLELGRTGYRRLVQTMDAR